MVLEVLLLSVHLFNSTGIDYSTSHKEFYHHCKKERDFLIYGIVGVFQSLLHKSMERNGEFPSVE